MDSQITPAPLTAADIHVVGGLQLIGTGVLCYEAGEALGRKRILGVILAPDLMPTSVTNMIHLAPKSRGSALSNTAMRGNNAKQH